MSVRPTPDGAPRPTHRSRLAHVLRIGADRAASTEGFILWDGGDGPKVPICLYETDRQKLYEVDESGRHRPRPDVCPQQMDFDDITRNPQWRAGRMEAFIAAGDRRGVMVELYDTLRFYQDFSRGDYPQYWGRRAWGIYFLITDADATGKNLFQMALERKQPEIFNELVDYYLANGDLDKRMNPSGQQDTSFRRFDVPSGNLIELALKNFVAAENMMRAEEAKLSHERDDALIRNYGREVTTWGTVAKELVNYGFDTSRGRLSIVTVADAFSDANVMAILGITPQSRYVVDLPRP